MITPQRIILDQIGDKGLGYISVVEAERLLPFQIKRVYWTYFTPHEVIRGNHAHKNLYQAIFAVSGEIEFKLIDRTGKEHNIKLSKPNVGLVIPPIVWREIKFSHSAVLLCLASEEFSEEDYIRDVDSFNQFIIQNENQ